MKVWPTFLIILCLATSCTSDIEVPEGLGYPHEIGKIIHNNCAVSGCHNTISKDAAAGLSLSTYSEMMKGANNYNSVVIPETPDQSTLLFFVNTFNDIGPSLSPTMPVGNSPLTRLEVEQIKRWIKNGAPNHENTEMYSSHNGRRKAYVLNTLCGLISVIDAETGLIMRYISTGDNGQTYPEVIRSSPDGDFVYVLNQAGELKQYDAREDQFVTSISLGEGFWRSLVISSDSKYGIAADWSGNSAYSGGDIAILDLKGMEILHRVNQPSDSIFFPVGLAVDPSFGTVYSSAHLGNFIYKIDLRNIDLPVVKRIMLSPGETPIFTGTAYKPGFLALSPDGDQVAVACERSNEIRFLSTETDELLGVVEVGRLPVNMTFVKGYNYLFVSCMEDEDTFQEGKGALYVIDYKSHELIKTIYSGYQPRGLGVDHQEEWLYVANRNADPVGADAPHHYTDCEGNNGYVSRVDLATLTLDEEYKVEVSVDPSDLTFKER